MSGRYAGIGRHLREGEDVRHARADARIQGSPEVHVAVGAQECEADACL